LTPTPSNSEDITGCKEAKKGRFTCAISAYQANLIKSLARSWVGEIESNILELADSFEVQSFDFQ